MSRRSLGLVIAAFVVTRLVTAWLAADSETYGAVAGDTVLYERWADRMVARGQLPYSEFRIEYPPGSLPLIALPEVIPDEVLSYRTSFVLLMVLVDVAGLVGLLILSRRWGSPLGPWLWVALIPLLGPITYLRLDLAPAVATVWAIERGSVRRWGWTGALLMFAAIAKIYALLLLPAALWVASDRRRFLLGATAMTVPLLLLGPSLDDSVRTLVEYHGERGIQIESLWGSFLLIAIRRGIDAFIVASFGAFHLFGDLTGSIRLAGLLASVAALCAGTWLAVRFVPRGDARQLAVAVFVILAMALAVGTVLSPQFLMWVFAPAAAALCAPHQAIRLPALLLLPAAVLTQLIYPFFYEDLVLYDGIALLFLYARNLLLAGIAALAFGFFYLDARQRPPLGAPLSPEVPSHSGRAAG